MATQLDSISQPDLELAVVGDRVLESGMGMGYTWPFWADMVEMWVYHSPHPHGLFARSSF